MNGQGGYSHTQKGKLNWLFFASAGTTAILMILLWHVPGALPILAAVMLTELTLPAIFSTLTVEDRGDHLLLRYGPLPVMQKRFRYDLLGGPATVGRTRGIDGWGIHWVAKRGWTYNLWGWDCVEMTYKGKPMRIGTDDPAGLAEFLNRRIAERADRSFG